jgi:murein L,D-transpeptidase YcbB/YkuD
VLRGEQVVRRRRSISGAPATTGSGQRPGPDNALGQLKFLLPNADNIYLHDTPAGRLFSLTDRAFSHGCIRLEHPKQLALALLER